MKNPIRILLAVALAGVSVFASASPIATRAGSDRAAELLARHGNVAIANVGPYVTTGTFRVQVAVKLGRPDFVLSDDTWLYHRRAIEGSRVEGTLIVRFRDGRVSSLALATPETVARLRNDEQTERLANK